MFVPIQSIKLYFLYLNSHKYYVPDFRETLFIQLFFFFRNIKTYLTKKVQNKTILIR